MFVAWISSALIDSRSFRGHPSHADAWPWYRGQLCFGALVNSTFNAVEFEVSNDLLRVLYVSGQRIRDLGDSIRSSTSSIRYHDKSGGSLESHDPPMFHLQQLKFTHAVWGCH